MKKLIIVLVVIVLVGLVIGGLYLSSSRKDNEGVGGGESVCDKISTAYQKDLCYATIAVERRDVKICEKITGPTERNACQSALSQSY